MAMNNQFVHEEKYSSSEVAMNNQFVHEEKYSSSEVKRFAQNTKQCPENQAFLFPAMTEHLESEIPGKKILDIGCGNGNWSYKVTQYGAKSVDGFDVQEEMVQLAKQATSQFSTVNIQVGDVQNMPYGDNTFDVAMSIYVTCCLPLETCISHFKELHRVLAPGGKAMVVNNFSPAFERLFIAQGADQTAVDNDIAKRLMNLTISHPSKEEVNNAFQDLHELLHGFFTCDENGHLQKITNLEMSNGQPIWAKTKIMTFADYFYDNHFFQQQINSAGLIIDNIENYYTEERRVAYNGTSPEFKLDKTYSNVPPFVLYHLSKPL